MAILNIDSLKKLAEEEKLFGGKHLEGSFQPSSYDLRIGTIYKKGEILSEDHPKKKRYFVKLKPSEIITLLTYEEIKMPQNYCGTVFAKNSLSSTGLLILNPGHIDPGFDGPVSICAINLSETSIKLRLHDSIFSIIIEELDKEVAKKDHYKNLICKNREELEEVMYRDKFSNLSNSFFDLILDYDKANKFLIDRIYENFKSFMKKGISALIIAVSLLGGWYLLFPDSSIFHLIPNEKEEIELYKDSLQNTRIELDIANIKKAIEIEDDTTNTGN